MSHDQQENATQLMQLDKERELQNADKNDDLVYDTGWAWIVLIGKFYSSHLRVSFLITFLLNYFLFK